MDFLVNEARAEGTPAVSAPPSGGGAAPMPQQQPDWAGLALPLIVLAVFYFLFMRPQQKRAKEQKQMLDSLTKGTEVVTTGGVLGRVADLDDSFVLLEVGDNLTLYVQRHAIANIVPKGTYKTRKKS